MKPINLNTAGCDPVSSNCVVWQGPDIPCLKLCKGDSVSDVIYKAATELCDLLTALDVTTFDLPEPCFANQACTPADFHDLIQTIINKICALEDCTGCGSSGSGQRTSGTTTGCPDCIVEIAKCFHYTNEFGDLVTTMQLSDYTRTIGNKVCDLVNQITNITYAISDLDARVAALEAAPVPTVLLPQVTPTCVITPAVPTDMSFVLSVLEQQFCQLVTTTGTPSAISSAIVKQCLNLTNDAALGTGGGTMGSIPGWIAASNTLASSLNNMWLTICDIRSAVKNIQLNCCPSGCSGIDIKLQATISGSDLKLFLTGTLPIGFSECNPLGNLFTITDSLGNSISTRINTVAYLNDPLGYVIYLSGTPISIIADMTITSDICYTNGTDTCQFCLTYTLVNQSNCPSLAVSSDPTGTGATITFSPTYVPATYTVEIWDSLFTTILDSQSQYLTVYGGATFIFSGLTPSTTYNARLVVNNGSKTTECAFAVFTTAPILCLPPSNPVATIALPVMCDTCGPALDFSDNATVDGTYVDVSSDYLLNYSGGSFGNIIQSVSSEAVTGSVRQPISFGGRTWIVTSATQINVYSDTETGTPVLDTTITPGVGGIVNMVYDTDLDLVFFLYNDGTDFRRIGTINPTTYAVTLNVGPAYSCCTYVGIMLYFNPVTFEKYVFVADGDIYVLSAGATGLTLKATLSAAGSANIRYMTFDPINGNVWLITDDSTNTEEVLVVNGTTYATITTLNTSVPGMQPYYSNSLINPMTFYSNGTDSTVYIVYRSTVANYNYMIITYNASTYAENTFLNEGVAEGSLSLRQIFYSSVFGKIVYTRASNVDMFDPSSSAVDYTPTITLSTSALNIHEDTVNSLLIFSLNVSSPTNNLLWYNVDPGNAVQCTQNIVDLVIGSSGPYEFNSTTSTWNAMCTSSVATVGSQIIVTATLSSSVTTAALVYSTNYGLTWSPLADAGGELFANPGVWLGGRTYNTPTGATTVKVSFSTTNSCGLEGISMSL